MWLVVDGEIIKGRLSRPFIPTFSLFFSFPHAVTNTDFCQYVLRFRWIVLNLSSG